MLGDLARPEPWLELRPEPYTAEEPRVLFLEMVLADMASDEEILSRVPVNRRLDTEVIRRLTDS